MMGLLRGLNLALRFLLELGLLVVLGFAGVELVDGALGYVAALVAVLAAAGIWGAVAAPRAPVELPSAARLVVEGVLFGVAVAALAVTDRPGLAAVVALVAVANRTLMLAWDQ